MALTTITAPTILIRLIRRNISADESITKQMNQKRKQSDDAVTLLSPISAPKHRPVQLDGNLRQRAYL
ncbi:MAG TPA: hypothetical protein VMF12_15770 [Xanthobacteraceae bacterium]|nr:hypothetical protein [Xanthobacteraceae bacterium]